MEFNIHLEGNEGSAHLRALANSILALGGLPLPAKSEPERMHIVHLGEVSQGALDALKKGASSELSVGYRAEVVTMSDMLRKVSEHLHELATEAGTGNVEIPGLVGTLRYSVHAVKTPTDVADEAWARAIKTPNELREVTAGPTTVPVPPTPPVPSAPPVSNLDAKGLPWDERIHSSARKLNADGTWRYRKNISDDLKATIESELRALVDGDAPPTIEVTTMEVTTSHVPAVPPAPPVPPIPSTVERSYSDVVNLIMAHREKLPPEVYVAVLGTDLPAFAKVCMSDPGAATVAFNTLDGLRGAP